MPNFKSDFQVFSVYRLFPITCEFIYLVTEMSLKTLLPFVLVIVCLISCGYCGVSEVNLSDNLSDSKEYPASAGRLS